MPRMKRDTGTRTVLVIWLVLARAFFRVRVQGVHVL